jgi:uncharacterized repeat protein (TIGR02543 family)
MRKLLITMAALIAAAGLLLAGCENPAGDGGNTSFTVTFAANGGSPEPENQTAARGGTVEEPPAMTRPGHTFDGWYRDAEFTSAWDFAADTVSAGTTLYAKWTQFFRFTVQTTAANEQFCIPVSGYLNGDNTEKTYNWNIDWGDGAAREAASGGSAANSPGIGHAYAVAGTYQITITPAGPPDAWLGAFGFSYNDLGANSQANKNRLVSVDSPIHPLMTRTRAQISGNTAPDYEWAYTFYQCQNPAFTMGPDFGFSPEWDGVTTAGDGFASAMFYRCSGNAFTMNSVFNLPQGVTTTGDGFAGDMFRWCYGAAFTMNSGFNLPQGITTTGDNFAWTMLYGCSGDAFTMNSVFNLPQGITAAGDGFAGAMFRECSGNAFTMNSVFNLPPGITTAGDDFASQMFLNCSDAFTMNEVFNLPQGVITAGSAFASQMFFGCSGAAFLVNEVFTFPASGSFGSSAFERTFSLGNGARTQTRTTASIINNRAAPSGEMNTFGPAAAWSDYGTIAENWR